MKRSKAYRAAAEKIDADQLYGPEEALGLVKGGASAKFDETVEVVMRLGVDPRKADQMVRGTVNLPNGTGKTARVLVFATGEKANEATAAGADEVGAVPESNCLWWMTAGLADETMTLLHWETGCRIQKNCPAAYRALPKKLQIWGLLLESG